MALTNNVTVPVQCPKCGNQFDKAVEWLEKASEQKGDDATIVEHLGDALDGLLDRCGGEVVDTDDLPCQRYDGGLLDTSRR